MVDCTPLGQSGFRLVHNGTTFFIDPYLSDSVERLEGIHQRRLVPVWKQPALIDDADWVLITHGHLDHYDPDTLIPLSKGSPDCRFVAPNRVCETLAREGISAGRLIVAPQKWLELGNGIRIRATPAAHPTVNVDSSGQWECVGYVMEFDGRRIYHSGDTSLSQSVIDYANQLKPIDTAILPVNEANFFRDQLGILGNMSIREAFGFAELLGVRTLVPMHWDMFKVNSVFQEEIELYYRLSAPPFNLLMNPDVL